MGIFTIYEVAWQRARDDGAGVRYQGRWPDREGLFDPRTTDSGDKDGAPVIHIYRMYYASPGDRASRALLDGSIVSEAQLRNELVAFSHEYGHFMSYLRETENAQWRRYHLVERRRGDLTIRACDERPPAADTDAHHELLRYLMQTELSQAERECILHEEALAWRIGRELLVSLGYEDMQSIDSREQHGIHNHRYRLGLDNLWTCDGQTGRCNETHR